MAKLFVVKEVNGTTPVVVSEWSDNESGAMVSFHDTCKVLWNASDVIKGYVKIFDEQLDVYKGISEFINHEATATEETAE